MKWKCRLISWNKTQYNIILSFVDDLRAHDEDGRIKEKSAALVAFYDMNGYLEMAYSVISLTEGASRNLHRDLKVNSRAAWSGPDSTRQWDLKHTISSVAQWI